jgi:hypothetical protein
VKSTSEAEYGTVYKPKDGNKGTSLTSGAGWQVDMPFDFDPSAGNLLHDHAQDLNRSLQQRLGGHRLYNQQLPQEGRLSFNHDRP